MHLGAFTPQVNLNILHVVLNNGVHESVGGQQSVGLVQTRQIATNSGYKTMGKLKNVDDIKQAVKSLLKMRALPSSRLSFENG